MRAGIDRGALRRQSFRLGEQIGAAEVAPDALLYLPVAQQQPLELHAERAQRSRAQQNEIFPGGLAASPLMLLDAIQVGRAERFPVTERSIPQACFIGFLQPWRIEVLLRQLRRVIFTAPVQQVDQFQPMVQGKPFGAGNRVEPVRALVQHPE
jgi:hypothetical protein